MDDILHAELQRLADSGYLVGYCEHDVLDMRVLLVKRLRAYQISGQTVGILLKKLKRL